MKAIKKHTRAEIESLIKSLLAWCNEQPEFTTGLEPDEDRILNPVDKLRLCRLAEQAKFFLQGFPNRKNAFQNFVTALSTNNIPATLMTGATLVDVLCELRNTLPKEKAAALPKDPQGKLVVPNKPGRKPKYEGEKTAKLAQQEYNKLREKQFKEDSAGAWNSVAKTFDFPNGKATQVYCKRYLQPEHITK
jgi:hypothetical protein